MAHGTLILKYTLTNYFVYILFYCLIAVCITDSSYANLAACAKTPADILFVLDGSTSIGIKDFEKERNFVAGLVNDLDIGPNDVQVSVGTFSDNARGYFYLHTHQNKTDLLNAIQNIPYEYGQTRTHLAFQLAEQYIFTNRSGDRVWATNIIFLLTSGQSQNHTATLLGAQKLKDAGVWIYAIGVGGHVQKSELQDIASDSGHFFMVDSFADLSSIHNLVQRTYCEISTPPPIPDACAAAPADILFLLDSSRSEGFHNFELQKNFVSKFVTFLNIGPNDAQVSVGTFSTHANSFFLLNSYHNQYSLLNAIARIPYLPGASHTDLALDMAEHYTFTPKNGDRPTAPNIVYVLTDGESDSQYHTHIAAQHLKGTGAEVFAIGVGHVSMNELIAMATDHEHVFTVNSFTDLESIQHLVQAKYCDVHSIVPPTAQLTTIPKNKSTTVISVTTTTLSSTTNKLTTSTIKTSSVKGPCVDKITNCAAYGDSVCTIYRRWSIENCARFCEFCHDVVTRQTTTTTSTTTPNTPVPTTRVYTVCEDKVPTCINYGPEICFKYTSWAAVQCPKFCVFCEGYSSTVEPPATVSPSATLKSTSILPSKSTTPTASKSTSETTTKSTITPSPTVTTHSIGRTAPISTKPTTQTTVVTASSATTPTTQTTFVTALSATSPTPPSTMTTKSTTASSSTTIETPPPIPSGPCVDKIGNCASYGDNVCVTYRKWSVINCARFCLFCHDTGTGPTRRTTATTPRMTTPLQTTEITPSPIPEGPCFDKTNNCASYGNDMCHNYRHWAISNCPRFCLFCKANRTPSSQPPSSTADSTHFVTPLQNPALLLTVMTQVNSSSTNQSSLTTTNTASSTTNASVATNQSSLTPTNTFFSTTIKSTRGQDQTFSCTDTMDGCSNWNLIYGICNASPDEKLTYDMAHQQCRLTCNLC